jgi:peptide chain release factor 1
MSADARIFQRLHEARSRLADLEGRLSDPAVTRDSDLLRTLTRERAELLPLVEAALEVEAAEGAVRELEELAAEDGGDPDLRAMAREELPALQLQLALALERAREAAIPVDPLEDRPAVLEIRAGTGGDEAGLFAGDLLRMYTRLAERSGWKVELLSLTEGIPGSVREAIVLVRGKGAFGRLRYESGVHRVQRVPETESQGRIHTSAATVAVLPEAEEVDVRIDPQDIRVDVFRSSGPGGQSVNTTDSAVRITHLPTGLVVSCQDEKSQLKNRNRAMQVLRSRLLDRELAAREAERARDRKAQVGTGDRSAKIRTYNFPQNRVTDHRIGLTVHAIADVMDGHLDEIVRELRLARDREQLEGQGE